jgi:hypothetical protein
VDAAVAAAAAQYAAIRARNASEFTRLDAQRTADLAVRAGRALFVCPLDFLACIVLLLMP